MRHLRPVHRTIRSTACSRDLPPTQAEQMWDVNDPRLEERQDWLGYPYRLNAVG